MPGLGEEGDLEGLQLRTWELGGTVVMCPLEFMCWEPNLQIHLMMGFEGGDLWRCLGLDEVIREKKIL